MLTKLVIFNKQTVILYLIFNHCVYNSFATKINYEKREETEIVIFKQTNKQKN